MKHKNHPTIFSRAALTLLLMLMASVTWAQGIGTDYYTLTLDPNYDGGSSRIVSNIASDDHITLNATLTPSRSGYYCIGWADTPSGDVVYAVGSTITVESNRTLYAKWEEGKAFFDGNIRYKVTSESPKTVELMYYVGNMTAGTNLTIPAKVSDYAVTSIDEVAFKNCSSLTSITIPASVTTIGKNAFLYCSGLTSVNFASGSQLTTIGQNAFLGCSGLTSVNFASCSQLTSIGQGAFYNTGLTSITIPASVTTIGQSAFSFCSGLTSVNFASGSQLTTIGNGAFNETGLTSITIPVSVTTIGQSAFQACI